MFLACPAEIILTLLLKIYGLPILTGNDQIRLVLFTTGWFPIKYSQFVVSDHMLISRSSMLVEPLEMSCAEPVDALAPQSWDLKAEDLHHQESLASDVHHEVLPDKMVTV